MTTPDPNRDPDPTKPDPNVPDPQQPDPNVPDPTSTDDERVYRTESSKVVTEDKPADE